MAVLGVFREFVEQQLSDEGSMLDIGCGSNAQFAHLRAFDRVIWGTDIQYHPQLIDPQWFRIMSPNGTIPFGDMQFDLVTAVAPFDPQTLKLSEIQRVLRPGGVFVTQSPIGNPLLHAIRRCLKLDRRKSTFSTLAKSAGLELVDLRSAIIVMKRPMEMATLLAA